MGNNHSRSTAFFDQDAEGSAEPVVFIGKRSGFVPQENLPATHPSPEDICILCEEAIAEAMKTHDEEILERAAEIMAAARCGSKVVVRVVNIPSAVLESLTQARPICCGRR